jgi:hypothetical protein
MALHRLRWGYGRHRATVASGGSVSNRAARSWNNANRTWQSRCPLGHDLSWLLSEQGSNETKAAYDMKPSKSLGKMASLAAMTGLCWLTPIQHVSAITVQFVNSEVNLGNGTQINLSSQYSAFGLHFTDVYRYIDNRDPFSDAPNQVGSSNLGISNGTASQGGKPAATGRVDFLGGTTSFITFDWWTHTGNSIEVDAYNALNVLQGSFTGGSNLSGTDTINGDIAYFTFHDHGGFVAIANLSYQLSPSVPDAGSVCLLLGMGMSAVGLLRRKLGQDPNPA